MLARHHPGFCREIRKNTPHSTFHTEIVWHFIGHGGCVIDDFVMVAAGNDARAATDAPVQVYHKCQLFHRSLLIA
jgi:hypothetical protein